MISLNTKSHSHNRFQTPNTLFTIRPINDRCCGLSTNPLQITLSQLQPEVRAVFQPVGPSYSTIVNSQYINLLQTPIALRARAPLIFEYARSKCDPQKQRIAHTHHHRKGTTIGSIFIVPGVTMDLSESYCTQSFQNGLIRFQRSMPALINVLAQTLGGSHPKVGIVLGNLGYNNAGLIMIPNQIQHERPVVPELPVEPEEANLGHEETEQPDQAEIFNMEE